MAATYDTKGHEAEYVAGLLARDGLDVVTVDVSTTGASSAARVQAREVAARHPGGAQAVFTGDRGTAIAAMALAFERYAAADAGIGALLGLGGSGGTALITPAMRALPIGVPKLMVSTMASGNVAPYVGPSDIAMMYSVTDVAGLNRISRRVLANAAGAIGGAFRQADSAAPGQRQPSRRRHQHVRRDHGPACSRCRCWSRTTTAWCSTPPAPGPVHGKTAGQPSAVRRAGPDHHRGLRLPVRRRAGLHRDRFGVPAHARALCGACGALDMVNFGGMETVPERYQGRLFYPHNPQVTLMRTTPAENARQGEWIASRLNRCDGPVRFLIPEGGVSALDAPGQAFWDPEADAALFTALETHSADRRPPPGAGALPHQRPAVRARRSSST